MAVNISTQIVLSAGEGLRLQSGPGRDLIFKVTGEDTNGAFEYFIVEVAPHGGPPLHVHHFQEETIHVLKGRFKIRIGDSIHYVNEGGFAYLPSKVPHAFLNLTDEGGTGTVEASVPEVWPAAVLRRRPGSAGPGHRHHRRAGPPVARGAQQGLGNRLPPGH